MISRKRLNIIVIALCLWLPLQAIAGQWLHCVQIESSLFQQELASTPKDHISCHEIAPDLQTDNTLNNDADQSLSSGKSCNHCQFSCTWHSALVLREFTPINIDTRIAYTQFNPLSPAQPALATPQRPPQQLQQQSLQSCA